MNIYVAYDRIAEESGACWESKNDGTAMRAFGKYIAENGLPADEWWCLCLGSIDHERNIITPEENGNRQVLPTVNVGTGEEG